MKFINNVYKLDFNVFNNFPLIKQELLTFATDFKNLKKLKISQFALSDIGKTKGINMTLLNTCINRIFQTKILFTEIVFTIDILLDFKKFYYTLFFCSRGRSYPTGVHLLISEI